MHQGFHELPPSRAECTESALLVLITGHGQTQDCLWTVVMCPPAQLPRASEVSLFGLEKSSP